MLKKLTRIGIPDLVVMTHTHFDHTGNAGLLSEHFGIPFMVQEREKEYLETGDSPVPNGTVGFTRFIYNLGAERVPQWFHQTGVKASVTFGDQISLTGYGLNARVIHTPGHSVGSSSIIIDDEFALAGDSMVGTPGSLLSPWGLDKTMMVKSWRTLLDTGCVLFHPSHGGEVDRMRLQRNYDRMMQ